MSRKIKLGVPTRGHFIGRWIVGYGRYMQFKQYLKTITHNQIVQERLNLIKFFDEFGPAATKKAFGYCRATIYLWKQRYKRSGNNPASLIPKSKRPQHFRRMEVDSLIISFIRDLREKYPRLGKEKIKPLLDTHCLQESLPTISVSTIGKVIKRNHLSFYLRGKVYHNPASSYALNRRERRRKSRISSKVKAQQPGELLQLDTIVRFEDGVKRYLVTAVDLFSRFSFALTYRSLSSRMALDFYRRLERVSPFRIQAIKTDNGLEFLGEFDNHLARQGVTHYFSYPRTPQSNSYIERFNRTLQEEFVESNLEYLEDTTTFNDRLIDYLIFFNTIRPHQALNLLTPMGYLIANHLVSNMCATRTVG